MYIYKKKSKNLLRPLKVLKSRKLFSILALLFVTILLLTVSVYFGGYLYKTGKMSLIKDELLAIPDRIKADIYYHTNKNPKIYIDIGFKELKRIEYSKKRNILNNSIGSSVSNDWGFCNYKI